MDAGVQIKASVAGIAMGLVKEGENFVVLSDILGDEDHLGDMDFKVAGTTAGITALQMDIKIEGITKEIMQIALKQAKAARIHILGVMDQAINTHRSELSEHAPRIYTLHINPEKIRDVIGKGGAVIRQITEESGTTIEIEDDGTVKIAATNSKAAGIAIAKIEAITAEIEVGTVYQGEVVRIVDFMLVDSMVVDFVLVDSVFVVVISVVNVVVDVVGVVVVATVVSVLQYSRRCSKLQLSKNCVKLSRQLKK